MTEEKKQVPVLSESEKIWEELRRKPLNLFGLPGQTVEKHVNRIPVPGDNLLLTLKSGAVLVALEESLGKDFEIEQSEKYVIVRRAKKSPF